MSLINRLWRVYRKFITGDPLVTFSKFLAINPSNRWGRIHAATCSLVFINLASATGIFYIHITEGLTYLVRLGMWLLLFALSTMVLSDWTVALIWPRNFRPPTKELKNVESSLEAFGFRVDDSTLRTRLGLLQIFVSFGQPIAFGFLDVVEIMKGTILPYQLCHFIYYVSAFNCINTSEFLFINYLYRIKRRFRELNRIVNEVKRKLVSSGSFPLNKFEEERIRYRLHVLRKAHFDLTSIAKKVNESFGLHLLLAYSFSTVIITEVGYQHYEVVESHRVTTARSFCLIFPWSCYHITRIFFMTFACSSTCDEAKKTAYPIHAIPLKETSLQLKDEVLKFSLQLKEQLYFTAAGFFKIDMSILRAITGFVVTNLAILIQLGNVKQAYN